MYPPADPWGDPTEPTPKYGRGSVPVPPAPREPTAELPLVYRTPPAAKPVAAKPVAAKPVKVSWEKVKNANRRSLSDGWGFTAAGLIVIVSGWVVWAASSRGTGTSIWPGFLLALVVGAAIFVFARTTSYYVLELTLRRTRPHARWSHFFAGLFLTLAGAWYLVNTRFQLTSGDWLQDGWHWLDDLFNGG